MNEIILIAFKEFSDRFRSGWVVACSLVWLGAISLASLFGLVQIGKIGLQGYERTVVSLLNLAQYLIPLLALLLGHDLLVGEREEKTLALILAGGVPRRRLLLAKLLGGALALSLPLTLGFAVAGTVIGLGAKDTGAAPLLRLGLSGLVLGFIFLAVGLLISTLCRTRVQALVFALLTWCAAVFVFDLAALGLIVTTHSGRAAREVEVATDTTHVNAMADMHAAFETGDDAAARATAKATRPTALWLVLNPVDLFRTFNLPKELAPSVPLPAAFLSLALWLAAALGSASWRLNRLDL